MDKPYSSKQSIAISIAILIALIFAGITSINSLVKHEYQRDLASWQTTLGIIVDTRTDQIKQWVNSQFMTLQELAENGSLQLYTKNLQINSENGSKTEPAQLSYLRNLMYSTAEKNGFWDAKRAASPIKASVAFEANASLALLDINQRIIIATPGASPLSEKMIATLETVLQTGLPALHDIYMSSSQKPLMGFMVPVFSLQVQKGTKEVIAVLVGIKNAEDTLFSFVKTPIAGLHTAESYLVRRDDNLVTYLSPLVNDTEALQRQLAADDLQLAAAFALHSPGSFGILQDYLGKSVLMTSRTLAGLPWVVVQKINQAEALSESKNHQRFLFTALFLSLLLITAMLIAAWWYGSSVREKKLAANLYSQSQELQAQSQLLTAINDNSSDYIFLLDNNASFLFANKALANRLQTAAEDLPGKGLRSVFGRNTEENILSIIEQSLQENKTIFHEIDIEINSQNTVFTVTSTPIVSDSSKSTLLVSLHDITEIQESQRRQAHLLEQLIRALMRSIDVHDPYSANHSSKTAIIAEAIGQAMGIDARQLHTLTTAAHLCNLGKLFIPKEILTKTTDLNSKEKELLRKETDNVANILKTIEFEGPVLETIVQKNECLDGRGTPHGLRTDDIIPTARILSVANAFVAMISPRAYRDKYSVTEAANMIISSADTCYDRQVVAALFHIVENVVDWNAWDDSKTQVEA